MAEPKVTVSFRVKPDVYLSWKAEAEKRRMSLTDVIIYAMEFLVGDEEERKEYGKNNI